MFPLAIATGNTFVLKPSEQDPSSTMRLVELAHEAGIPPGVLNVVHGGPDVANQIADHQDIKALSFIGSTHVGSLLYNRAAAAGKRMQAMMGLKTTAWLCPMLTEVKQSTICWGQHSVPLASGVWRTRWSCSWVKLERG